MNKSKNLVYDVGMHRGEDTDYYLKKGFKVIGFEANPDLVKVCQKRFQKELKKGILKIVEGAIVENTNNQRVNDKVQFFKNSKKSVWGTVVQDWAERYEMFGSSNEVLEVSTINFSEYLKKYGIPYYLKVDIEGMDLVCLKSLLNFKDRPDYISIESEKKNFNNLKEEFVLLKKLGYDKFQIINQAKICSQKEPVYSKEGCFLNYRFKIGSTGMFGSDLDCLNWKNFQEAISKYRRIFFGYHFLGEHSKINRFFLGRLFTRALNKLIGVPGWFDTHAQHSSLNIKK